MNKKEDRPRIGVGVMIWRGGKVLIGQRKGAHGTGEYSFPGGHLEYMETFEECAIRETREEAGIEIENIRFNYLANVRSYAPRHYTHIGLIADWKSGEAVVMEPHKNDKWEWCDPHHLPAPLFKMCAMAFSSMASGQIYYDL